MVSLHPVVVGEVRQPGDFDARPRSTREIASSALRKRDWRWWPVPVFLIEHPAEGPVLVDTGLSPEAAQSARRAVGPVLSFFMPVRSAPQQQLLTRLRERGVEPGDISTIVMTHLHADHTGGLPSFPDATVVVDGAEREHSHKANETTGYRRPDYEAHARWREVEGDEVDVFGDGTIRLLATPGHTAGHRSVVVATEGGDTLLCADAAYTTRTLDEGCDPMLAWSYDAFRWSLRRLQAWRDEHPGARVYPGHDPEVLGAATAP
jgi:glyoxylase-like metal-dependent hydrolase (beta-lactamase superfamily II)